MGVCVFVCTTYAVCVIITTDWIQTERESDLNVTRIWCHCIYILLAQMFFSKNKFSSWCTCGRRRMLCCLSTRFMSWKKRWTWLIRWGTSSRTSSDSRWVLQTLHTFVAPVLMILPQLLQPFNGPLSRTTRVSRYQKGKTNLDFTEATDNKWQWH